jgi:two-component system LytT family sensor kinase
MALNPVIRKRLIWLGLFLGVWTLLALLSSLGGYVSHLGMDHKAPVWPLLRQEFKDWYACGAMSLGALWFCGRNVLEPGRGRRWALRHLGAGLTLAGASSVLTAWLVAGEPSVSHPGRILTFSYLLETIGIECVILNLIMYWMVVFAHLGWHYYQRFREREVQAAELRRELVEARLDALRMQLNPHFLFNTLHAISALIHEDPETADRMVARLSELLRLSLDASKAQEVPLTEELDFLDRYLEIEQTRFGDRLRIEKQIAPEVREALVPYLILQPLVENAIRHGIEPREETGHLLISARRDNGQLDLRIRDNGSGLPESASVPTRQGIGLANTRSRLGHLYGQDYGFDLAPAPGGGLEARLTIPFRTARQSLEHGAFGSPDGVRGLASQTADATQQPPPAPKLQAS